MSTIGHDLLHARPPIKALFVYNSNPVAVAPQAGEVVRGFARDDLFTVVHDLFQTDTADYADILLPATSHMEQLDIHKSYGHLHLQVNQPAIAPLGEAVSNTELFRRLASAMGFSESALPTPTKTSAARPSTGTTRASPACRGRSSRPTATPA
jgi:anaerobic selenocysteine-containing dehydrogenase